MMAIENLPPARSSGAATIVRILPLLLGVCFSVGVSEAALAQRTYRASYLPAEITGKDFKIDDNGNVFSVSSLPAPGGKSMTKFYIFRPMSDWVHTAGVQTIPGPITPAMGQYDLIDINQKGQFVCSENSIFDDHRFLWDGSKFVELRPLPPYDVLGTIPELPNLYSSDHLHPTSINDDGTVCGISDLVGDVNDDSGGEVRWDIGGNPTLMFKFRSRDDPLRFGLGRNERGRFLRYNLAGNITNATFWNGLSTTLGFSIPHPPSSALRLNDNSDVAGIVAASREIWIYVPQASYGLTAGYHLLSGVKAESSAPSFVLNNLGEIIASTDDPAQPLAVWRNNEWRAVRVLDPSNNVLAISGGILDSNAKGQMVVAGNVVLTPLDELTVTVDVTPRELGLGEEFDMRLDIRNNLDIPLNNVGILVSSMIFTGAVIADWIKAPPSLLTLAPGASGTLHYIYRTKARGRARLRFQVEALNAAGLREALTDNLFSPQISVLKGDLLIKRDVESPSLFGVDDGYQDNPSGEQIRKNVVSTNELSQFQVQIQNDDNVPQTFRLTALESSGKGWNANYLFGDLDISTQLRSASGYQFPTLATNQSYNLTVQMTLTGTPFDPDMHTVFALRNVDAPTQILDTAEAVSAVPDVDVRAIEVTQVVQDWQHSVPLVAGKKTLVRVFPQRPTGSGPIDHINARLRAYRDGIELSESPLSSMDGSIDVRSDASVDREDLENSLNFYLPLAWIQGQVKFQLEPLDFKARYRDPATAGGQEKDGIVTASFVTVPDLPLVIHRVVERLNSGNVTRVSHDDVSRTIRRTEAMLPVRRVDWRYGFSPAIAAREIPDVPDLQKVNHQIKATDSYVECPMCDIHLALLPYRGDTPTDLGQSGGGLADGIPSFLATARLSSSFRSWDWVHELGHVLGRHHAVGASLGTVTAADGTALLQGVCGEYAKLSAPDFPYFASVINSGSTNTMSLLGPWDRGADSLVYGYDSLDEKIVDWRYSCELMGYCDVAYPTIHPWPSKFTYEGLKDSISTRFGAGVSSSLHSLAQPVRQMVLRGLIKFDGDTAELLPVRSIMTAQSVFMPDAGPYRLEILGPAGAVIDAYEFDATLEIEKLRGASFFFVVPQPDNLQGITLKRGGKQLMSIKATARAPTVRLLSPNGGESFDADEVTIRWQASDADGDPLRYLVDYSADGGSNWDALAVDFPDTELTVPRSLLRGSQNAFIRVHASDGLLSTTDMSDASFHVADNPPQVFIISPSGESPASGGGRVYFQAAAFDAEDGTIPESKIKWTSNLSGDLGTGLLIDRAVAGLKLGVHEITATATDTAGHSTSASMSLTVVKYPPARLNNFRVAADGRLEFELRSTAGSTSVIETSTDMRQWISVLTQTAQRNIEPIRLERPAEAQMLFIRVMTR